MSHPRVKSELSLGLFWSIGINKQRRRARPALQRIILFSDGSSETSPTWTSHLPIVVNLVHQNTSEKCGIFFFCKPIKRLFQAFQSLLTGFCVFFYAITLEVCFRSSVCPAGLRSEYELRREMNKLRDHIDGMGDE